MQITLDNKVDINKVQVGMRYHRQRQTFSDNFINGWRSFSSHETDCCKYNKASNECCTRVQYWYDHCVSTQMDRQTDTMPVSNIQDTVLICYTTTTAVHSVTLFNKLVKGILLALLTASVETVLRQSLDSSINGCNTAQTQATHNLQCP